MVISRKVVYLVYHLICDKVSRDPVLGSIFTPRVCYVLRFPPGSRPDTGVLERWRCDLLPRHSARTLDQPIRVETDGREDIAGASTVCMVISSGQ